MALEERAVVTWWVGALTREHTEVPGVPVTLSFSILALVTCGHFVIFQTVHLQLVHFSVLYTSIERAKKQKNVK